MKELIFTIVIGMTMTWLGFEIGYESGQLDALVGKQHFHLVTNTVSSVTWQKIK